ncbi:MAG: peptide chain release factor-like protein [Phycisphaerae bacterium]|nr:peptide chain release factor-like protein [Phycisphaerae bacterium]
MHGRDYLALDDKALLAQCDVHTYKSSGPGGQHRNKVSSAVRLRHRPTGVTTHGDQSRSQHDNKRLALQRLRMNIACSLRGPIDPAGPLPATLQECLFTARGGPNAGHKRLQVGRRDSRYWQVAAYLLDAVNHFQGRMADAAAHVGISTGNLVGLLEQDRHPLAAAQAIRKAYHLRPLG